MSESVIQNSPQEVFAVLSQSTSPLCMIDDRLDYDAFCSALAMKYILKREYGIDLRLTYVSTIPDYFLTILSEFIDPLSIEVGKSPTEIDFSKHDLVLYLDSAELLKPARFELYKLPEGMHTVNIDHHVASNSLFAGYNIVRETPATCALLYELFAELDIDIDKTVAALLLLGLLDDTQLFSISDVRTVDLKLASHSLGICDCLLFYFVRKLTWNISPEVALIRKIAYKNLVIDIDDRVAYTHISLKDLNDFHVDPEFQSTVSISDEIKVFDGIDLAFTIKEKSMGEGGYTVSIRSRNPDYDASEIASHVGGGGHTMAAGGQMRGVESIETAIENILGLIDKYRKDHNLV